MSTSSDATTSDIFTSAYPNECSTVGTAVRNGDITKLKELLSRGEDYTIKDNRGWYPMHEAASGGKDDCVEALLEAAWKDCDANKEVLSWAFPQAYSGVTPLSLAAEHSHLKVLELLVPIYKNADAATTGYAMHVACENGNIKGARLLAKELPYLINSRDRLSGMYPLHIAVEQKNTAVTQILLKHGAKTDVCDFDHLKTPLHITCAGGHIPLTRLLIKAGHAVNLLDDKGCTPLFLAAQSGQVEVVKLLLENGADGSVGVSFDDSVFSMGYPISVAAEKGFLDIVKVLEPVTPKVETACSAVILAALNKHNDCLEFLLEKGFPTFKSTQDCSVNTPWEHLLSKNSSPDFARTVRILLHHNTPFHELAKLNEFMSLRCSLMPLRFSNIQRDVLKEFLNAGLMELHLKCQPYPCITEIIQSFSDFKSRLLPLIVPFHNKRMLLLVNLALCVSYFPFVKILKSSRPDLVDSHHWLLSADLVGKAASLKELCRWSTRCAVIKSCGMISPLLLMDIDLPKDLKAYLTYC